VRVLGIVGCGLWAVGCGLRFGRVGERRG